MSRRICTRWMVLAHNRLNVCLGLLFQLIQDSLGLGLRSAAAVSKEAVASLA